MSNTAKLISELLLERLKQAAVLEQTTAGPVEESTALPNVPSGLFGAGVSPSLQPKAEKLPNRKAAQRAYAQITGADYCPPDME